jgi:uncharacterized membrane protein
MVRSEKEQNAGLARLLSTLFKVSAFMSFIVGIVFVVERATGGDVSMFWIVGLLIGFPVALLFLSVVMGNAAHRD